MAEVDSRAARIAELEAMVAARDARIAELMAKVEVLTTRVAELEARLSQNSSNSSKPPSSDGPGARRQPKKPTGRSPGGQPGHKKHERELLPPERVRHVVELVPKECKDCGRGWGGETGSRAALGGGRGRGAAPPSGGGGAAAVGRCHGVSQPCAGMRRVRHGDTRGSARVRQQCLRR